MPCLVHAGHSIAWTLYFLTKHPDVMAKLEAELDQAGLLVTPQRPHPRAFTWADVGKLTYLDSVIKASGMPPPIGALHLHATHAFACKPLASSLRGFSAGCKMRQSFLLGVWHAPLMR